ncbi:hypothetical protein ACS0TY_026597 [Phlomoides rotata]
MAWIRSAVSRAVEVGGNNNLSRAVRSYADTVVNQAVVGGAKLFQDRYGARNLPNFKLAAKRLEEVSVSCRGIERVQLLRRWLVSLKQIERLNEAVNAEYLDNSQPTVVLYYDPDLGGEPLNFRDVFLHSQALEGITLSLILEEPNEEELSLLQGIFRLCLTGGKEALDVTVSSVQDLSKAFSTYTEEVLAKREELLQYAQDAMAGLKVNAEIVRIDSEVSNIHRQLDDMKDQLPVSGCEMSSEKSYGMSMENLNDALTHVRLCSRLAELLLRKKLIMKNGHSPADHNKKVDKLKVLSESLASSASKAEKRISDNRLQKEEALSFRIAKSSEVSILEKEMAAEIKALEMRKDELEEELKKVKTALNSVHLRLHNAREERDQFEEASNQIIQHFNMRDDELSKAIASHRAEGKVCNTFINFLQSSWAFQSSSAELKDKLVNEELERHEEYFANLAINVLDAVKEELGPSISSFRKLVKKLRRLDRITGPEGQFDALNPKKILVEECQATETKVTTAISLMESIEKQFSVQQGEDSRITNEKVKEAIDAVKKMKHVFESTERPRVESDSPPIREETPSKPKTPRISFLSAKEKGEVSIESTTKVEAQRGMSLSFTPMAMITLPLVRSSSTKIKDMSEVEHLEAFGISSTKSQDAEAQLSKLKFELELDDHSNDNSTDMEGIIDWEFDDMGDQKPRKSI